MVFTPFYKILNKAPFDLEVMEAEFPHAEWFTVLSGKKEVQAKSMLCFFVFFPLNVCLFYLMNFGNVKYFYILGKTFQYKKVDMK